MKPGLAEVLLPLLGGLAAAASPYAGRGLMVASELSDRGRRRKVEEEEIAAERADRAARQRLEAEEQAREGTDRAERERRSAALGAALESLYPGGKTAGGPADTIGALLRTLEPERAVPLALEQMERSRTSAATAAREANEGRAKAQQTAVDSAKRTRLGSALSALLGQGPEDQALAAAVGYDPARATSAVVSSIAGRREAAEGASRRAAEHAAEATEKAAEQRAAQLLRLGSAIEERRKVLRGMDNDQVELQAKVIEASTSGVEAQAPYVQRLQSMTRERQRIQGELDELMAGVAALEGRGAPPSPSPAPPAPAAASPTPGAAPNVVRPVRDAQGRLVAPGTPPAAAAPPQATAPQPAAPAPAATSPAPAPASPPAVAPAAPAQAAATGDGLGAVLAAIVKRMGESAQGEKRNIRDFLWGVDEDPAALEALLARLGVAT